MYDLIIIGAGPAGITASVYAARKKMNFLVLTKDIGGQTAWSGDIENYTGYQFITGPELVMKFEEHLEKYNIPVKRNEAVLELKKGTNAFQVKTDKGEYRSRTVIMASGKGSRMLNVPGEKEFRNRGLTYCATCDGPLFANKDVAVIGGGNSALDAVLQLINIAKHVHLINITPSLSGDLIMQEKVMKSEKVTVRNSTRVTEITGDRMVSGIKVTGEDKEELLPVQGVFVEIGLIPNSGFVKDVLKNKVNEIIVNCNCGTSIPGLFGAGDVTDVYAKQIIVACGEGAKAALASFDYISKSK